MPHIKTMFDRSLIGAFDLQGKEMVLEIERVKAETLTLKGTQKIKKPVVFFKGRELGFALNKTNAGAIEAMYGSETNNWIGKLIAIYPTTTTVGNKTHECIRVKPTIPQPSRRRDDQSEGDR